MMPVKQLSIAVIGDEDLVSGMRLAGVSRYTLISDERSAGDTVRASVNTLLTEDVGVIAIQEDFMPFIQDIVLQMREEKRLFPVIIEVPSKRGSKVDEVIANYRAFVRKFVGFDIQI